MALVSVVIPTRTRAGMLAQALRSVLGQVAVDLEVVVVDDGSTDGTAALLSGIDDGRVGVVRNDSSQGVSAARNAGIERAAGEWIAFLDDDDLWAPDKLARQLDGAAAHGRRWVYAGDVNVDAGLRVLGGAAPPPPDVVVSSLDRYNSVPAGASNVVVHRDLLAAAGTFDPGLKTSEDWDLWIRLARAGPPACVPRPLVAYRIHPGNVVTDPASIVAEPVLIGERYGLDVDRAAMLRRAAWTCLRAGRRAPAVRFYALAVARGDVKSLGRAAIALLLPPRVLSNPFRIRGVAGSTDSWARAAGEWIEEIIAAARSEGHSTVPDGQT